MKFTKTIDVEDFQSAELKPYLQAIADEEMAFFGIENPGITCDSKNWETAMALRAFGENDLLKEGKLFAGIGAGIERLTELLASRGALVFPTDRYLEPTFRSDAAPSGYMISPKSFSSFCSHPKNIIPVHSDPRSLNLPSNLFDGVYSLGSIEHFGSLDAVEAASHEIARILKPGGIASISTEFFLEGPAGRSSFDENCILFTPEMIEKHIIRSSGLESLGTPNNRPSAQTFGTRRVLTDFLKSSKSAKTFLDKVDAYPNLVLYHDGFLFCSVHILLKKPLDWKPVAVSEAKVSLFSKEIETRNQSAIIKLQNGLSNPNATLLSNKTSETKLPQKTLLFHLLSEVNELLKRMPKLRYFIMRLLFLSPGLAAFLRRKLKTFGIVP
ncbi:MAG: class I SAM-dependent methyltransferase [Chlamydiales bacterium]|nr:class I SAM-dependent methyltransferase [Chlamydiales bacterium]